MLAAPSFRADVERLRSETERSRAVLRRFGEIELSSGAVKITRSVAAAARARAEEAPCLVISVPGGGKSGVVSDVVEALLGDAQDVVALAADSYKVADEAELAERLASKSAVALRQAKAALRAAFTMEEDAGLRFEQEAFGLTFASEDRVEGTRAFVQKRDPKWQHK